MDILRKLFSNPNFWGAIAGLGGVIASTCGLSSGSIQQIVVIIGSVITTVISLLGYNIQQTAHIKAQAQIEAKK
jgi:hypothetical protein